MLGGRRGSCPSALIRGRLEGQELLFMLSSFPVVDCLVQENFAASMPTDPHINMILL